jgi:glycosyltransferase involved in cell wall biosynthesis
VASALSQDYPNYEVVICDDSTTDGTWDFLKNIKDPKVRVFRNVVNLGNHGNHNQTVLHAKGEFIKFLHDDDELPPDSLSYMLPWLLLYPNVVATVVPLICIDENSEVVGKAPTVKAPLLVTGKVNLHKMPRWGNQIGCTGNILVRKKSYRAVAGMDTKMKFSADFDLFAKLSSIGDWIYLPDAGYRYRGNNITSLTYTIKRCSNAITVINEHLDIAVNTGSILRPYRLSPNEIKRWEARICSHCLPTGLSFLLRQKIIGPLHYIMRQIHKRGLKTLTLYYALTETLPFYLRYSYYKRVTGWGYKKGQIKHLMGTQLAKPE